MPLSLPLSSFPRVVPWLAILGLLLLRHNRCGQAWLVWLPLLLVAGLVLGGGKWLGFVDSGFRETAQRLAMAMGFGWAAALLLAPWAAWRPKLGRFGPLLVILGAFGLLGLALGHDWGQGMFDDILEMVCAVLLQFVVFAVAAVTSLSGWSVRRRFTIPGFLKWFVLWLIVVWVTLAIPCATLASFGRREGLAAVLGVAGLCSLASFVVSLAFLMLSAANSLYRRRLQQLAVPPEPTN